MAILLNIYHHCVSMKCGTLSEPGYYEDGKFGIRIENIMLTVKADTKVL